MSAKQAFVLLGVVGLGVYLYQRFINPRCAWCGAALAAVAVGQRVVCPSCGRTV